MRAALSQSAPKRRANQFRERGRHTPKEISTAPGDTLSMVAPSVVIKPCFAKLRRTALFIAFAVLHAQSLSRDVRLTARVKAKLAPALTPICWAAAALLPEADRSAVIGSRPTHVADRSGPSRAARNPGSRAWNRLHGRDERSHSIAGNVCGRPTRAASTISAAQTMPSDG